MSKYIKREDALDAVLFALVGTGYQSKAIGGGREVIDHGTHKSWLLTCPCGDGNFKSHLKEATESEIEEVLAELTEKGNKSKIAVLTAELKRRRKAK